MNRPELALRAHGRRFRMARLGTPVFEASHWEEAFSLTLDERMQAMIDARGSVREV